MSKCVCSDKKRGGERETKRDKYVRGKSVQCKKTTTNVEEAETSPAIIPCWITTTTGDGRSPTETFGDDKII